LRVREIAEADSNFIGISEVMTITGLISNGDITTIYVGMAWVPSEKYALQEKARGLMSQLSFFEGKLLSDDLEYGIGIGNGLAEKLHSQFGTDVILMAPTVFGQINAVDAHVLQFTDASMELLEDKWVVMPLSLARTLYDTEGASQINLLLRENANLGVVRSALEKKFHDAGIDVTVVPWRDLSPFYVKVEKMFRIIFLFMFLIVSIIIVMSVVNTVSMAVLERSREIGTLRAIGAQRYRVIMLFGFEGALLGLFGCLIGVVILGAALAFLGYAQPYWTPPQMARPIPLEVYLVPEYLLFSVLFLTLLSFASGVLPARQIARHNIVEALGHV
ncbi:MAG: FtsX-like permease family protein, partial [Chromatiaceae bacterium]